jgi:hypothetical protein
VQGVELSWVGDLGVPSRLAVMIHDGSYMSAINWNQEVTDLAIAARGEFLVIGKDWAHAEDFTAFSDQKQMMLVGVAVDWQLIETGPGANFESDNASHLKFTADLSYKYPEWQNFNFFAAYIGQYVYEHTGLTSDSGLSNVHAYQQAVVVQTGVHLIPDKLEFFGRYEYFNTDGLIYYQAPEDGGQRVALDISSGDDTIYQIVTLGMNYYLHRNQAKVSVDGMYVFNQVEEANRGAGINDYSNSDGDSEQLVIRAQLQLRF